MLKQSLLLLFACLSLTHALDATPAQVIIIRHAEKPPQGDSLSTKGRERAAAFAPYFMETKELLNYNTPVAIYATATSKADTSLRPVETVTPLADTLKLTIKKFERDDYLKMVKEIMDDSSYHGKMVLICWEHTFIPEIARAFKAFQTPNKWANETFDRVWMISIEQSGKANFKNLPQRLMYGDSTN